MSKSLNDIMRERANSTAQPTIGSPLNGLWSAVEKRTKGTGQRWEEKKDTKETKKFYDEHKEKKKKDNRVPWGKGERDWLGRKKDKSKRNTRTKWNIWD